MREVERFAVDDITNRGLGPRDETLCTPVELRLEEGLRDRHEKVEAATARAEEKGRSRCPAS